MCKLVEEYIFSGKKEVTGWPDSGMENFTSWIQETENETGGGADKRQTAYIFCIVIHLLNTPSDINLNVFLKKTTVKFWL